MGENHAAGKPIKPVIIALSIILAVVAIFVFVSDTINRKATADERIAEQALIKKSENAGAITSYYNKGKTDFVQGIANPNQKIASHIAEQEIGPNLDPTQRNDGSVLPANSPSSLIKAATATNRWSASSVISSVVAERVAVNLNVYDDNGIITSQTKTRYLYVAEISTKPSRVSYIAASQFTPNNICGMKTIIKDYESATNQDVLFASSDEMCVRDSSNPLNNIFYNGNNTPTATVIKNSSVAQKGEVSAQSLTINKDGIWEYPVRVSMSTCEELIKNGTIASVSYTFPVIWKGEKYKHPEIGVNTGIWDDHYISAQQTGSNENKMLIGKVGADKYIVVMSDGFGYGYLAEYMLNELGVQDAYWGGGGIVPTMYIKGYGVITPNSYVVHGDLFCVK